MGSSTEGVGLPAGAQMGLLVVLVGPSLIATVVHVLARSAETSWLACAGEENKKRWSIFGVFNNNQSGLTTCAILQRNYTILFGSRSQWTTPYSNVPNTTKTNENVAKSHCNIAKSECGPKCRLNCERIRDDCTADDKPKPGFLMMKPCGGNQRFVYTPVRDGW